MPVRAHTVDEAGGLLEEGRCTVAPRQVKRAEAYMLENLSQVITIDDLVATRGASARSLFEAFRRYCAIAV